MKVNLFFKLNQARYFVQADMIAYQQLVGKLMYPGYKIQWDIAFVKGQLSCHDSDPQHVKFVLAKKYYTNLKEQVLYVLYREKT